MKKLLSIFVALFVFSIAAAQEKHSIIIDQESFRPIQTDALTGVAIDPIGKDSSRRDCARVKVKINRMSKAEIDGIEVKIHTNNELIKCKTAEYDNGLILELTALASTRFYFYHPDFGYSNEVTLKLEANKEFYLEASLNQTYSIVVNSNVVDADVYIDGNFKGRTGSNYSLTVSEVMVGSHTLRVDYCGIKHEQKIEVNKGSIQFRQIVNTEASKPQFVVFVVRPENAILMIENSVYQLQDGATSFMLENGTYNYTISAPDYHDLRGTFTVAGTKVEQVLSLSPAYGWLSVLGKSVEGAAVLVDNKAIGTAPISEYKLSSGEHQVRIIKELYKPYSSTITINDNKTTNFTPTLVADFANVVLSAPNGAEIWVNGVQKGSGSWSGKLSSGVYLLEARKAGHKSNSMTQTIAASSTEQRYTLPAPTPITGSIVISGTPVMADVAIDGTNVGRLPLSLDNLIVGNHNVTVSKQGYVDYNQTVTIEEGKSATINVTLKKFVASSLKGVTPIDVDTSLSADKLNSKGNDLYNKEDFNAAVQYFYAAAEKGHSTGQSWMGFCYEYGKGVTQDYAEAVVWYRKSANQGSDYAANRLAECYYWGRGVEKDYSEAVKLYRQAADKGNKNAQYSLGWCYEKGNGVSINITEAKAWYRKAAAQSHDDAQKRLNALNGSSSSTAASKASSTTSGKVYQIGDYYNENGLVGVVFEVSADGKSGKIVSLSQPEDGKTAWAVGSYERGRAIGATYTDDGAKNMAIVKRISDWQTKYPAFAWCAKLGSAWYLPAIDELELLLFNDTVRNKVNKTIEAHNGTKISDRGAPRWYWSSTEEGKEVKMVLMDHNKISSREKNFTDTYTFTRIRAVAKFGNGASSGYSSNSSQSNNYSNNSSSSYSGNSSGRVYNIGDIYNENGKKGVVFWTDASGKYGKIISIEQSSSEMAWASVHEDCYKRHGMSDQYDGYKNMQKMKSISGWENRFPPFAWCDNLGDGWYLPTVNELWLVYKNRELIQPKLNGVGNDHYYYTSTEVDTDAKKAFTVNVFDGTVISYNSLKFSKHYVRAVATFGTPTSHSIKTSGPYKVGDYYNENGKEGVVFRVNSSGTSGLIVSLNERYTMWANRDEYESETKRRIKATDEDNGWNNLQVVRSISLWENKYPAFAWCTALGSGWYLPATNELKSLLLDSSVYNAVNSTLKSVGAPELAKPNEKKHSEYWVSTESNDKPINGSYQACTIAMGWMFISDSFKYNQALVRAVAKF